MKGSQSGADRRTMMRWMASSRVRRRGSVVDSSARSWWLGFEEGRVDWVRWKKRRDDDDNDDVLEERKDFEKERERERAIGGLVWVGSGEC